MNQIGSIYTMEDLSAIMAGILNTYTYEQVLSAMESTTSCILVTVPAEILAKISVCARSVGIFIRVNKQLNSIVRSPEYAECAALLTRCNSRALPGIHQWSLMQKFDINWYLKYYSVSDLRDILTADPSLTRFLNSAVAMRHALLAPSYEMFECIMDFTCRPGAHMTPTGETIDYIRKYAEKPHIRKHIMRYIPGSISKVFSAEEIVELATIAELTDDECSTVIYECPHVCGILLRKYPNVIKVKCMRQSSFIRMVVCYHHPYNREQFLQTLECDENSIEYKACTHMYDLGHPNG